MALKLNETDFFKKLYEKGFEDGEANQLLKLFADGFDLSYIPVTTDKKLLRQLRTLLKNADNSVKDAYKYGIDNEMDVLKFSDENYTGERIRKLLDLSDWYDISLLLRPEFTDDQFEVLKNAMENDMSIKEFADPDIDAKKMEFCIKSLSQHVNLSKYARNHNIYNLQVLKEALQSFPPVDMTYLDNPKLDPNQMKIILKGLEAGIDVSFFADEKYTDAQMFILLKSKMEYALPLHKYVDETYSAREMSLYLNIMHQNKELGKKLLNCSKTHKRFNQYQLIMFNDYLKNGKNIVDIINPDYSIERMKLIMASTPNERELYKDLSINDLTLHLYKYNFTDDIKHSRENIEDVQPMISNVIYSKIKNKSSLYIPNGKINNKNAYYANNHRILEIKKIKNKNEKTDKYKNYYNERYCTYDNDNISIFGRLQMRHVLSSNEKKMDNFIDKYFLTNWDEENEELKITSLFNNVTLTYPYKNKDYSTIYNLLYLTMYGYNFDEFAYEFDAESREMDAIFELFDILDIDPNEYYIFEDIHDEFGCVINKICVEKEDIDESAVWDAYHSEHEAILDLKRTASEIEESINDILYITTFYDKDGLIVDDYDEPCTQNILNDILRYECSDFEYAGAFESIDECVKNFKIAEMFYEDEVR